MRPQPMIAKPVGREGEALDEDIDGIQLGRAACKCRVCAACWVCGV
jgi:hypothetical protein